MSNFHPLFVPSEVPLPLRQQALKYAMSKNSSKVDVGAGDGMSDKPKTVFKYDPVFMKSLRFKDLSTSKPDKLPFVPGIIPGVVVEKPYSEPEKPFRLIPQPPAPFGIPVEPPYFPYIRHFTPSQSAPCHVGCGMDPEYKRLPGGDKDDEPDMNDMHAERFATPPFAFSVPFNYPFPAYH